MYGPYFIHVISSYSILHTIRVHSIIHFNETGGNYSQFAYKVGLIETGVIREGRLMELLRCVGIHEFDRWELFFWHSFSLAGCVSYNFPPVSFEIYLYPIHF